MKPLSKLVPAFSVTALVLLAIPLKGAPDGSAPATAPATAGDPQPVPVGKGSYAAFPPTPDKHVQEMLDKVLYIDPSQNGKPIPTNHWWSYLMHTPTTGKSHGRVWPYPLAVEADATGATVCYPTEWNKRGNDMEPGAGLLVTGDAFTPSDACVLNWGDWSMALRYRQDDDHLMDVTLGRGMPYAWFEFKGVTAQVNLAPGATLEDAKGQPSHAAREHQPDHRQPGQPALRDLRSRRCDLQWRCDQSQSDGRAGPDSVSRRGRASFRRSNGPADDLCVRHTA